MGSRGDRRGRKGGGDGKDYSGSPVEFVCEMLGGEPYSKQEEVLRSVAESRRTSVVGCNGSGKDWAAARAVLWWLHTRSPSKAVVTGPTSRQVDHIVWNEIRHAYAGSEGRLKGPDVQDVAVRGGRSDVCDRVRDELALQPAGVSFAEPAGGHNRGPRGQRRRHGRSSPAESCEAADDGQPVHVGGGVLRLAPLAPGLYQTVRISASDTPNVAEQGAWWSPG